MTITLGSIEESEKKSNDACVNFKRFVISLNFIIHEKLV